MKKKKDNKNVGFTCHKMPVSTNLKFCLEFIFGCNKCNYYIYDIRGKKKITDQNICPASCFKKWSLHPYSLSLSAFEMVLFAHM